jgi:hypothetical protein
LHREGLAQRGEKAGKLPMRQPKADHTGSASCAGVSSPHARPRSDTAALSPKRRAGRLGLIRTWVTLSPYLSRASRPPKRRLLPPLTPISRQPPPRHVLLQQTVLHQLVPMRQQPLARCLRPYVASKTPPALHNLRLLAVTTLNASTPSQNTTSRKG